MTKPSKLMQMVNCRIRITLTDGRVMLGQLLAYDKHLNLVVADCEEFRLSRKEAQKTAGRTVPAGSGLGDQRRSLGLVLLRGETIVSMIPEGGPPPAGGNKARVPASKQMAPGMTMQGRAVPAPGAPPMPGMGMVPPPLTGQVPGMYGAPPPGMMMPPAMYPPPHYPPHPHPPQ